MAHVNLGQNWRLPNKSDVQELYDHCTSEWTNMNGVAGCLFTSNVNGNKIFLPAAGYYDGTSLRTRGESGRYWTASYYTAKNAYYLYFISSGVYPQVNNDRYLGFTVRAVTS